MRYLVGIREVHVLTVEVEADSPDEAKRAAEVARSEGQQDSLTEYSHDLSRDEWSVEPKPPK